MSRAGIIGLSLSLFACGRPGVGEGGGGGSESSGGESSTGEGAGSEETGEPTTCGEVSFVPSYVPPVVMLVVDESQSMLASWDHDADPNTPAKTRWASARELVELLEGVFDSRMHVGLQLFPNADACPAATEATPECADASACAIASPPELAPTEDNFSAVLATLPGPSPAPVELAGGSPAAAAFASAVVELEQALLEPEVGPGYVLLLTDGRINCGAELEPPSSLAVHDPALHDAVADAYATKGIRTMVIAIDEDADPSLDLGADTIPGFDPRPALHELGLVGGVANGHDLGVEAYYSASAPEQIATALEGACEVSDCVVDLSTTAEGPPEPEQIPLVTWERDGEPLPFVEPEQCDDEDGWTWIEGEDWPAGSIVTFCGQACDDFKFGEARFDGYYGCPDPI